jgi:polyisoprenoid-binding protein YceI
MNSRPISFSICLLAATLCVTRPAHSADVYKIDPRHTSIIFSIGHAELSYTYGMFRVARGNYVIDKQNQSNTRFQLEIDAASLFTNDEERDNHLRSPDFFNVKQFPTITFESTSCTMTNTVDGPPELQLVGTLTMHGVPRQIEFPMQFLAEKKGPRGDYRSGFYCDLVLKRSDFDIATGLVDKTSVGDVVRVTISFEGVKDTTARQ